MYKTSRKKWKTRVGTDFFRHHELSYSPTRRHVGAISPLRPATLAPLFLPLLSPVYAEAGLNCTIVSTSSLFSETSATTLRPHVGACEMLSIG